MKSNLPPAPARDDHSRPAPAREKPPTIPPGLDDDRVELVSWDAPLVPSER